MAIDKAIFNLFIDIMKVVTSADKAYDYLKSIGEYMTRATVREIWRTVGEKDAWATVSATYGVDRPTPRAWIMEKETKEATGIMHVIHVDVIRHDTGEKDTMTYSGVYDTQKTYSDVWRDIESDVELYSDVYGFTIIGWRPGGIFNMVPRG